MKKVFLLTVTVILAAFILAGCGGETAKITNIDGTANTFDIIDTKTNQVLKYDKLVILGKEVIDHYCMSSITDSVAFAFEESQIIRDGSSVTLDGENANTIHAEFEYTLTDGILTLTKLVD